MILSFTAGAILNGNIISETEGKINIEKNNPEMRDLSMDTELLHSIATITGGSLVYPDKTDELVRRINQVNTNKAILVHSSNEYKLWSHEATLIVLILLLSTEWFIRKRAGMM